MANGMDQRTAVSPGIVERAAGIREWIDALPDSFIGTAFSNRAAKPGRFREVRSLVARKSISALALQGDYRKIRQQTFAETPARGQPSVDARIETKAPPGIFFHSFPWVCADGPTTGLEVARNVAGIVLAVVLKDRD